MCLTLQAIPRVCRVGPVLANAQRCAPTHGFLAESLAEREHPSGKVPSQRTSGSNGRCRRVARWRWAVILRVKAKGASWVFRFTAPSGRRRELGLGSADRASLEAAGASLKRARKKADEARDLLDRKPPVDPIDAKAAERRAARKVEAERKAAAKRERTTLCRVARAYHESTIEPSRTFVHSKEWIASLERHVPKKIWSPMPTNVGSWPIPSGTRSAPPCCQTSLPGVRQTLELRWPVLGCP